MIDRYGHQDDAIERFQTRMQRAFVESIVALRPVALRIIEQIEGAKGDETMRAVAYEDAEGVEWMVLDENGKIVIYGTDEHTARLIAQRLSN